MSKSSLLFLIRIISYSPMLEDLNRSTNNFIIMLTIDFIRDFIHHEVAFNPPKFIDLSHVLSES